MKCVWKSIVIDKKGLEKKLIIKLKRLTKYIYKKKVYIERF